MPKPGKPLFTRTTPIKRDPNYSPREAKLLDVSDPERPIRTRLRFRLAHYARKAVHADNFGTRLEYALEQLERMDRYVTGRKGLGEFDAAMRALKMALGADHALANEHLPAFQLTWESTPL